MRRVDEAYKNERKDFTDKISSLSKDLDKYKGLFSDAQKAMDAAKAQLQGTAPSLSQRDEDKGDKMKQSEEKSKARDTETPKDRSAEKSKDRTEAKDRSAEKSKDRTAEKSKDRTAEKSKDRTPENSKDDKEDTAKDRVQRTSSKGYECYILPSEVPTELEPDDDQDNQKKRRKLLPSKPAESLSPSKRVRFSENTKKTTYAKPRAKVAARPRKGSLDLGNEDVYTFRE